jgi:hypothetical protein
VSVQKAAAKAALLWNTRYHNPFPRQWPAACAGPGCSRNPFREHPELHAARFAHGGSREEEILKLLRRIDRQLARLVAG